MGETLPEEAEALFSSEEFVAERNRLAKELRGAGRREEADAVAKLRKPAKVVVAINRAARGLPVHARAAVASAEKLARAQAAGDRRKVDDAHARLERAIARLAAHAAEDGGDRAAIAQLVRAALTGPETRRQLAEGRLTEPPVAAGFDALAGLTITAKSPPARGGRPQPNRPARAVDRDAARRRALQEELSEARAALREAERAEASARRAREAAQRRVDAIEARLEHLGAGR